MDSERRGRVIEVGPQTPGPLTPEEVRAFGQLDVIYQDLCALLRRGDPDAAQPGGPSWCGRPAQALLFETLEADLAWPARPDADLLLFAGERQATCLYALWALRDELARIAAPELLPRMPERRLRLEDLLGYPERRTADASLRGAPGSRLLDRCPTPATPFVPVAAGAAGLGLGAAVGLALAAADIYGTKGPRVHVVEEGADFASGDCGEAVALAARAGLGNLTLHLGWSVRPEEAEGCDDAGSAPADGGEGTTGELLLTHGWNLLRVADGQDVAQIACAQRTAAELDDGRPAAIFYRTAGGAEAGPRAGAGSGAAAARPVDAGAEAGPLGEHALLWAALQVVRRALESAPELCRTFGQRLGRSRERLGRQGRRPRWPTPRAQAVHDRARAAPLSPPLELRLQPGASVGMGGELARVLRHFAKLGSGALLLATADPRDPARLGEAASGWPGGTFHARTNPGSRLLPAGGGPGGGGGSGDGLTAVLSGVAAFGHHVGVVASAGAPLAPLGHAAARLHVLGMQAREQAHGTPFGALLWICGHAGRLPGEGPDRSDPPALHLLQGDFPEGTAITLTPWEPQEIWPLLVTALGRRPALLAPFLPLPPIVVPDREQLGLAPAAVAAAGLYRLRAPAGRPDGTLLLQGAGAANTFVRETLPRLLELGIDLEVYCVSSAELFDALHPEDQESIWGEARSLAAIAFTDFTLPTLARWIRSERGLSLSLHASLPCAPPAGARPDVGLQLRAIRSWLGR